MEGDKKKVDNVDDDYDEEEEEEESQETKDESLLEACRDDNVEEAQIWLDKKANPLFIKDGWNAVLWAACNGNDKLIRILHINGATGFYMPDSGISYEDGAKNEEAEYDPFVKPKDPRKEGKYTPLHWASYKGHLRMVWILLKIGMSPLDIDMYGNSSVHQAAASGTLNVL